MGLTQRRLAQELEVDASAITHFLQGAPTFSAEKVEQLADILHIPRKELTQLYELARPLHAMSTFLSKGAGTHLTADYWHISEQASLDHLADYPGKLVLRRFVIWEPLGCDDNAGTWLKSFVARRTLLGYETVIQIIVLSALQHGTIAARILFKEKKLDALGKVLSDGAGTGAISEDQRHYERALQAAKDVARSYEFYETLHADVLRAQEGGAKVSLEVRACVGWIPKPSMIIYKDEDVALTVIGSYGRATGFRSNPATVFLIQNRLCKQTADEFMATWDQSIALFDRATTSKGREFAQEICRTAQNEDYQVAKLFQHLCESEAHVRVVQSERDFEREVAARAQAEQGVTV